MSRFAYDRSSRRYDANGHLHVERCNISKANVCPYYGREIPNYAGLGLEPNRLYRMYRDPAELQRAADTFANLPLLIRHVAFTADRPARESWVGTIGSKISFDGTYLVADHVTIQTAEAIRLIETEEQDELSSSYAYRADMTPGVHPEYGAYDGVMRDLGGNHVALVVEGRAGPDVRVSDSQLPELQRMNAARKAQLIALAVAAGNAQPTDAQLIAMDAALPPLAEDMRPQAWDGWTAEDRRRAMDAWRTCAGVAADATLTTEQECSAWDWAHDNDPHLRPPGASDQRPSRVVPPVIRPQINLDAAVRRAEDAATARVIALYAARDAVRPFVGEVLACDTAEGVYRFALEQMGNKYAKTLPAASLGPMFEQMAANRTLQQGQPRSPNAQRANDGRTVNFAKSLGGFIDIEVLPG